MSKKDLHLPVIQRILAFMPKSLAVLVPNQECFGRLWIDEDGPCPEAVECDLARHCQVVFEEVQERATHALPPTEPVKDVEEENKRVKGKWRGTGKYERHGYVSSGRPVDVTIRRLIHELGYPEVLPKNWSPLKFREKYKRLGRLTVVPTSSYHTFLVDGKMVCRFWTTAAGRGVVDVCPEIESVVKKAGVSLEPLAAHKKNGTCTGRFFCKTEDEAVSLANWIRDTYNLQFARPEFHKE